jgi:hypothetical protein
MQSEIQIDFSQVKKGLDNYSKLMQKKFSDSAIRISAEGENEMKRSAPWTDRTGNARNGLQGQVSEDEDITIFLTTQMYYGKYLELCNGGKYRIIWPTVEWLVSKLERFLI